ncbi:hypothetical protein ACFL3D_02180 [Candidatus Omnitrophota bacterium]
MALLKMMKEIICFSFVLIMLFGCASPEKNIVTMTPTQAYFIKNLDTEYDNLLDQARDDIVIQFGEPNRTRRYTINDERREQLTYYVAKPGFESEPKTLHIYCKDNIVTGFNLFDGIVREEDKQQVKLGDKVSLVGT